MSLTNTQYNEIIREYEQLRLKNIHELDNRTAEIYEKIPEIARINDEISSLSVQEVKARLLSEHPSGKEDIRKTISELSQKKLDLLKKHGYPPDYLSMHYTCELCRDTGYVENQMCSCMRAKVIHVLYEQSNLKELVEKENFSTFRVDYYPEDMTDAALEISARENILHTLNICRNFVNDFNNNYQNLFLYGAAGVGKTFLINCIAKELMDQSRSVIYMSAIHFFQVLADASFHKGNNLTDYETVVYRDLYQCDLLIIDDLGTEVNNSFTASSLFHCINERANRKKPVIISTNLSLSNLRDLYSDRVFSRIVSSYKMLKIFGKDLRIMQSLQ